MSVSTNVNTFKCYIYRSKPRRMFSHSPNTRTFPMHIQPLLVLKGSKKITRENNENRPFVSTLANRTRSNRRYRPVRDVLFHRMRANNTKKIAKNRGVPSFSTQVLRRTSVVWCVSLFFFKEKRGQARRGPNFHLLRRVKKKRKNEKNKIVTHFSLFSLRRVLREHGTHLRRRGE